jgi:hypothetical protein
VLHLFDHTICPILLYGCENWGTLSAYKINNNNLSLFETFKDWDFEKLNIKFCRYLLGVNKKSTNFLNLFLPKVFDKFISMFSVLQKNFTVEYHVSVYPDLYNDLYSS